MTAFDGLTAAAGAAVLVVNPGKTTEHRISNGTGSACLLFAEARKRTGENAPRLRFKIVDYGGKAWRSLTFGSKVTLYLHGTAAFTGTVVIPKRDLIGGAVLLDVDAVGRAHLLYSRTVAADATYQNQTTGTIAKAVLDAEFPGILDTSNVTTATGVTLTEFTVSAGDNVGAVLESLSKMDGYSFDVDESDKVYYYAVSATSQLTIEEGDLFGGSLVETGVVPPRNIVTVRGGSGYAEKTLQESSDSYYNLTSSNHRVAQSFIAATDRLSGIQLYCNRTADPNLPGTLAVRVESDGKDVGVTIATGSSYQGSFDTSPTLWRESQLFVTNANYSNQVLTSLKVQLNKVGSSAVNWHLGVYSSSGSSNPDTLLTTEYTGSVSASGDFDVTITPSLALTANTAYHWVLRMTSGDASNYLRTRTDTANPYSPGLRKWSTDGGSTWTGGAGDHDHRMVATIIASDYPSGTAVEWSDDVSFTATDFPYPPSWSTSEETYSSPKLVLTEGTKYWIVLRDAGTPSGTKYWGVAYYNASSVYADGRALTSTDAASTWSVLNYDLRFRLMWSSGSVDVKRTNAQAKLTGAVTDVATSLPVDETRDFDTFPTTVRVDAEEMTVSARSTTSGAGNLTVTARGINGTTAAAHSSGRYVDAYSVFSYGPWAYQETDSRLTQEDVAVNVASNLLTKHADPLDRLTLRLKKAQPGLTPRSVVTVERPLLGLSGDFEIAEIAHTVNDKEILSTVTIGSLPYDATAAVERVSKREV